jgi:hypothetical protein
MNSVGAVVRSDRSAERGWEGDNETLTQTPYAPMPRMKTSPKPGTFGA